MGCMSSTDYKQPKQILVPSATNKGYEIATDGDSINLSVPDSKTRRGRVGKGVAQTLDTACNQGVIAGTLRTHKDGNGFRKMGDGLCPTIPARAREDGSGEWSRPFKMSELYDDIVVGPSIDKLIENGILVKELSFIKQYTDNSKLELDNDGEFTTSSMNTVYGSEKALFNVLLNYEELCEGKKTIIFNSSTTMNLILYERFKEAGHNVKMFDSVNQVSSDDRVDVIKWFRDTPDAILMNVGVFTTGFDVKDVEAIIINRPTNSLSLFIQIAGRGARSTDKIYKDKFILRTGS